MSVPDDIEGRPLEDEQLVERALKRLVRELDLSVDPADLRGWGQQGLLEARQRFDPSRGVRFSTFAYYRVRGAMLDGVRRQGWIRRSAYAKLKAIEAADSLSEAEGETHAQGPAPNLAERARSVDDILAKISAAYLLSAVGQDEQEPRDTPETMLEREEQRSVVKESLSVLPERERTLVEAIYFGGATIEEAGARLGLSKSWASRMHAKALDRLKKNVSRRL
jgi:RNA polymerase sigma factor for flagellar operon FliA